MDFGMVSQHLGKHRKPSTIPQTRFKDMHLSEGPLCHPWENSLFYPTDDMVVPRMENSIGVKSKAPLLLTTG